LRIALYSASIRKPTQNSLLMERAMEQEKRENQQSSKQANGQKVWETPTLETQQAAEGIQGGGLVPNSDALLGS